MIQFWEYLLEFQNHSKKGSRQEGIFICLFVLIVTKRKIKELHLASLAQSITLLHQIS